jgi:N-acetylglucosamine-6-sulfatase
MRPRALVAACVAVAAGAALLALTPAASSSRTAAPVDARPTIVIVLTDDQRVHTIGPTRMPHVWSILQQQGRTYPNASVPTSLCCPSRASILTGLFAHSTRVFSNTLPFGGWDVFHARGMEDRTVAVALHDAGYHTALVGKYLNGSFPEALADGYRPPGWDDFVSFTTAPNYYNYSLNDGRTYGDDADDYSTDVLAARAEQLIRQAPADKPLFLYLATIGPHRPFTAAPRDVGTWEGRLPTYDPPSVTENVADKPPWVRDRRRVRQTRIDADLAEGQDALMSVDDAVGGVADALSETGRLDNTLFVYLSDNGLLVGEHHLPEWKNLPYRWATSAPLLIRWDGHITPGSVDSRLALNVDLAQTISAAAGLGMTTEGLDLLSSAKRTGFPLEATRWFANDSLPKHEAYCGYRTKRWMFVQYAGGFRELYDYAHDPQELTNRAYDSAYAHTRRTLLAHARQTCRPVPPDFHWVLGGPTHVPSAAPAP